MRVGRAIVLPAALMLAVAGSTLAATAAPAAAGHISSSQVVAQGPGAVTSGVFYHC